MYTNNPPAYSIADLDFESVSDYSDDNTNDSFMEISSTQAAESPQTGFTTLSTEIIGEILLHVCTPTQNGDHELNVDPSQRWVRGNHPLALGSVCRGWRDYIWSTSGFWTTVILRLRQSTDRFPLDILKDWLYRAKGRPLDVFVYCPPTSVPREVKYMGEALTLLAEYFEQWRSIEAHLPLMWSQHLFLKSSTLTKEGIISRFPFLRQAILNYKVDHLGHIYNSQLPDFIQVKSLQNLSLLGVSILGLHSLQRINTKPITTLTLHHCSGIILHALLDRCPQLRNLTILSSQVAYVPLTTRTTHEKIQTLTIDLVDYRSLDDLLFPFSFPNLKSLSVHSNRGFSYTKYILPLLENSKCNLTKLFLKCPISAQNEYDLIHLFSEDSISSSLQELYIEDYKPPSLDPPNFFETGLGRTFFENLHPDQDPSYLPQLEVLEYKGPLAVSDIDFLEPLVIRSKIRDRLGSSGEFLATKSNFDAQMATLRKVVIKSDQYSETTEFTISEYSDSHYIWEIINLMDADVFSLRNTDGSTWV